MNKYPIAALCMLVVLAGCGKKHKNKVEKNAKGKEISKEIDIPVAAGSAKNFFDEDVSEFTLQDGVKGATKDQEHLAANVDAQSAWLQDESQTPAGRFDTLYFEFDKYAVREDQESALNNDITVALNTLKEQGVTKPSVVVEGHACRSAGSRQYNLVLSEKRANVIVDRLVAAGVARENIKVVGRGYEVPALVDGKPLTNGNREQQAPNRRVEFHVIYS